MKIDILGCSGGIGSGLKTTSFLVDGELLVDAGSGVETLTQEQMLAIRTVLLTHAHIDHILGLPLMLATIFHRHQEPVQVFALPEVIEALRTHIFNGTIWPDFTQLPEERPIVILNEIRVGDGFSLGDYQILPLPAAHPSPTAGYLIRNGHGSFAFSGDSGVNLPFWDLVNQHRPDLLIVDVSFTNAAGDLARRSGHLTADQLGSALSGLAYRPCIRATHLKPGFEAEITAQCAQYEGFDLRPLYHGECIRLN